ncbi:MAG TPA: hypothetical protein VHP82_04210 [Gaiellaceae bacterium]|nr:hypothetical protein [Gaiellaceae bacterium]
MKRLFLSLVAAIVLALALVGSGSAFTVQPPNGTCQAPVVPPSPGNSMNVPAPWPGPWNAFNSLGNSNAIVDTTESCG